MLDFLFNRSVTATIAKNTSQNISYSFATTQNNTELANEDPLEKVVSEMRGRAENPIIGLSRLLGRLLGTIEQDDFKERLEFNEGIEFDDEYIHQITTLHTSLEDDLSSEQALLQWDHEPLEILPPKTENADNDNICQYQSESMKPQAVILSSGENDDDAIRERILDREDPELSYNILKSFDSYFRDMLSISDHYELSQRKITNIPEICQELKKINEQGPIKLLIFDAHGTPKSLLLSYSPSGQEIKISLDNYKPWKKNELSCLGDYLEKDVTIILDSCSTGLNHLQRIGESNFYNMNIQMLIASFVPGSTVLAPDYDIITNSMRIQFTPTLEVTGQGFDTQGIAQEICNPKEMNKKKHEDCLIMEQWSASRNLGKDLHRFFSGKLLLPKRPFQKISPQNADFCKEERTYLSMQKYCNDAGIIPPAFEKKIKQGLKG